VYKSLYVHAFISLEIYDRYTFGVFRHHRPFFLSFGVGD
jgi:hypothetical protein